VALVLLAAAHWARGEAVAALPSGTGRPSIEGDVSGVRVEYSYEPPIGTAPHTDELREVRWFLAGALWRRVEHDYDDDGRRTVTHLFEGESTLRATQEFGHDDAGWLTSIKNDGVLQAEFAYQHGFLVKTTLGNGVQIVRDYDEKGRLEGIRQLTSSCEVLADISYAYDRLDRRTSAFYGHLGLLSTFEYTPNSWLKKETHTTSSGTVEGSCENHEAAFQGANISAPSFSNVVSASGAPVTVDLSISYGYTIRGNRHTKDVMGGPGDASYLYDDEDRLTTEVRDGTTIGYAYAKRGDLTTKTVGSEVSFFETDYMARIVHYTSPTEDWSYLYAPTGDRIAKTNLASPEENTWDLMDGGDVLASYHRVGATEVFDSIYVSPGMDGRVARIDAGGSASYFFLDALNSVHQTTNATGAVSGTNLTDAWGNHVALSIATPGGANARFDFTNREREPESGLMHYRARTYDPATGRFLSRDPAPKSNLYTYASNSPATGIDPSGQDVEVTEGELGWYLTVFDPELLEVAESHEGVFRIGLAGKATPERLAGSFVNYLVGHAARAVEDPEAEVEYWFTRRTDILKVFATEFANEVALLHAEGVVQTSFGADWLKPKISARFPTPAEREEEQAFREHQERLMQGGPLANPEGFDVLLESAATLYIGAIANAWRATRAAAFVGENRRIGLATEEVVGAREAATGATVARHAHHQVAAGSRFVDVLKKEMSGGKLRTAFEVKTGPVSLNNDEIRRQLARDWWLKKSGKVNHVVWEFFPRAGTGGGPDSKLRDKLIKLGFEVVVHQ
jgi:RHS repeat-associated protein